MTRPLRILFVPFGSQGDVDPLLALAALVAVRGHQPVFLLTPHYGHLAERRGFEWHPVGTEEDFLRLVNDPALWKPGTGSWRVAKAMHESLPSYQRAFEIAGGTFDLVVTSSFGLAASVLAESRGIPRLMLHLQPMCVRSHGDMFVPSAGGEWIPHAPALVQDALFLCVDAILNKTMLPPLNAFRSSLGLLRVKDFYRDALMRAEGLALLVPAWFAPPQPDWPNGLRAFDFLLSQDPAAEIPSDLSAWLDEGEPPVLWTHGSANLHLRRAQRLALDVTSRIGGRALLVGKVSPDFALPRGTFHSSYVDFGRVFPRCRAVVHHGGIGTTSKAFAAGIPQVVLPLAHDQHDNAARIERLHAGLGSLPNPRRVAQQLTRVFQDPEIRAGVQKCRLLAKDSPAQAAALADWVAELAGDAVGNA